MKIYFLEAPTDNFPLEMTILENNFPFFYKRFSDFIGIACV